MDETRQEGPQLEGGYVRIANELLDAILAFKLSGRQLAVLMTIVRKTYGYGKKKDDVSASQLGAACGVSRNHVTETLHQLEAMNVISMSRGEYGMLIGVNKHYAQWNKGAPSPKSGLVPNRDATSPKLGLVLVPKRDGSIVLNRDTQKTTFQKTTSKDNPNKSYAQSRDCAASEAFEKFWQAFGLKKGRKQAEATFLKAYAAEQDKAAWLDRVLAAAAKEAKRRPHLVADGRTPMYAQGWISQQRFDDEDLAGWGEFTEPQQAFVDLFNENIGDVCPRVEEWGEKRAALIDIALRRKWPADSWARFWRFVRDECLFRWPVSIEWVLDLENFDKVKGGQYAAEVESR